MKTEKIGAVRRYFCLLECKKQIHSTICHVALFPVISAENLIAPPPPSAAGPLFKYLYLSFIKKNLGYSEKKRVSPHFDEIIRCFSAFFFSLAKHICLSNENLQKTALPCPFGFQKKTLKIDNFERGISEQFPMAYDGIHMKLLNLELFISKALTFSDIFVSLYVFIVVQDLGPGPPPSRLGIN